MNRWPVVCGVLGLLVHLSCSDSTSSSGKANIGDAGASGEAGAGPGSSSDAGAAGTTQAGGEAGVAGSDAAGAAGDSTGGGGGSNTGGASGGGGTSGGGGSNTSGAGGGGGAMACNDVPHLGQTFTTTANKAATAPVLTQGTIHAGLYVQTADAYYGTMAPDPQTATGATVRISVVDQTATLQFDALESELPENMQIVMGQPVTAVPQSVEIVCVPADVATPVNSFLTGITYQASDTQFQLESVGGGQGYLSTFTLQAGQ
jgi:hypothetical protein